MRSAPDLEWPYFGSEEKFPIIARRADAAVGKGVLVFDGNRRIYLRKGEGPSYRHHFKPMRIVGETSRSWLVGWSAESACKATKFAKAAPGFFGLLDAEDAIWRNDNAYRISETIRWGRFPTDQLREIAKIIGYKEPGP